MQNNKAMGFRHFAKGLYLRFFVDRKGKTNGPDVPSVRIVAQASQYYNTFSKYSRL